MVETKNVYKQKMCGNNKGEHYLQSELRTMFAKNVIKKSKIGKKCRKIVKCCDKNWKILKKSKYGEKFEKFTLQKYYCYKHYLGTMLKKY